MEGRLVVLEYEVSDRNGKGMGLTRHLGSY